MSLTKNKKLIKKIYSHSQSLAQCKNWIQKNFPNAKKVPVSSNSEAALLASKNKDCAVIGNLNAGKIYGLKIIEKNIQDYSDNKTRFVLLGLEEIPASESDKTSIVFSSNNKPGSLFKILEPLAKKNINLTKLESRPIKSSNWEYFIYLDLSGHMSDKNVRFCLDSIKSHTKFFKILGSYPRSIL
jgi:chorismate mutase/prephenate dehydratase